jgi:hypothetical protein
MTYICNATPFSEINNQGRAVVFLGKSNAEACEEQINANPLPAGNPGMGTVDFPQLTPGMQFCLFGDDGNSALG